jgi:hypothetical protein
LVKELLSLQEGLIALFTFTKNVFHVILFVPWYEIKKLPGHRVHGALNICPINRDRKLEPFVPIVGTPSVKIIPQCQNCINCKY